jgi:hypothetical protein
VEAVSANIEKLEAEVKEEVLHHGASIRGTFFHAIWNRGRVSWDTSKMDQFASEHPEILQFRKEGKPYISILKK